MTARICWRCGKAIEPSEHLYNYKSHDYHEPCVLTVVRRDDPALARVMERNRANRAQRERARKEYETRLAGGGPQA